MHLTRTQAEKRRLRAAWAVALIIGVVPNAVLGCSTETSGAVSTADASSGARTSNGGNSNGGEGNGGASSGGVSAGGTSSGGASNAGASNGGASVGGVTGTSGAGGVDGGVDGAMPAPDPCATALFCETFEGYSTGGPPGGDWTTQTNHGAITVSGSQHFGGLKAAEFSVEANSGAKTAFIRLSSASVFPVAGNAFFGRMMTRLESAPDRSVHWTFIQGGGLVPGETYHALYRYGGQHPVTLNSAFVGSQLMANYETPDSYSGNGPGSDCWDHADKVVLPTAQWACVEWQFDGPANTMRFWLDGAAVDSLTVQGTGEGCVNQPASFEWKAPTFDNVELGWESYQGDDARTLYLDDIVLSKNRVGCPPNP